MHFVSVLLKALFCVFVHPIYCESAVKNIRAGVWRIFTLILKYTLRALVYFRVVYHAGVENGIFFASKLFGCKLGSFESSLDFQALEN